MMENKYIKLRILLVGIIFITAFAAIAAKYIAATGCRRKHPTSTKNH